MSNILVFDLLRQTRSVIKKWQNGSSSLLIHAWAREGYFRKFVSKDRQLSIPFRINFTKFVIIFSKNYNAFFEFV